MPSKKFRPADIFQCTRCGDCCKGFGGTYVTDAEIKAIAAFIKIDADEFLVKYCQASGQRQVLAQGQNGYCIFWDGLCRIHPVKPRMCRLWPFIESVLVDINNWQIMAGMCPGIRSDIPDRCVRECVKQKIEKDNT
ncbi:MAG: YkgJ family cysteine cluster protein [Desulfobacterales bacterium]|nr:YkgJ family cysteine cluster protein [Desulfobacterales bacterium]